MAARAPVLLEEDRTTPGSLEELKERVNEVNRKSTWPGVWSMLAVPLPKAKSSLGYSGSISSGSRMRLRIAAAAFSAITPIPYLVRKSVKSFDPFLSSHTSRERPISFSSIYTGAPVCPCSHREAPM